MLKFITYLFFSLTIGYTIQNDSITKNIELELIASSKTDAPLTNVVSLDARIENSSIEIYLADIFTSSVIELSRNGNQLVISNKLGQGGKGPGEFEEVSNVQVLQEEKIFAYDKALGRATIFNATGEVDQMFNITQTGEHHFFPMKMYHWKNKSNIFHAISKHFFRATDNFDKERKVLLQKYHSKGDLAKDSILVKPASEALVVTESGGMAVNPNPPFGKKSIFRSYSKNIFYGWTGRNKIEKYSITGKHLSSIELKLPSKEVTRNDIALAKDNSYKEFKEAIVEWAPEKWPYYEDFLVDDNGRIWIAESSHLQADESTWHIFNQEGKEIGRIYLPRKLKLYQIKNNYAFGVLMDDQNRPIVQLYKLVNK